MIRLRAVLVDLMIDLTIMQEMAERQGDKRRAGASTKLLSRLRMSAQSLKVFEEKGKFDSIPEQIERVEHAHRAFSESYDLTQAERAADQIEALFADVD